MDLQTELVGGCLVAAVLACEVDHTGSEEFKEAVLARYEAAKALDLLLDLGAVAFMDSKAIGAMVSVRKAVAARGGRMGICRLHPHVDKIIRVVTLGAVFDVFADREAGLARYA